MKKKKKKKIISLIKKKKKKKDVSYHVISDESSKLKPEAEEREREKAMYL